MAKSKVSKPSTFSRGAPLDERARGAAAFRAGNPYPLLADGEGQSRFAGGSFA